MCSSAFYWECEAFPVAVGPWTSGQKLQRVVRARVAVAEQRTPGFALRFDLELLENAAESDWKPCGHLMRLVNQRQMLQTFEFAFVGDEAETRRAPAGGDAALDERVKKWLAGGGLVQAPPKEELAAWLLHWMLVVRDKHTDEWLVLLGGEKGADAMEEGCPSLADEEGDCADPVGSAADDGDSLRDDDSDGETEDDDLPPPYEQVEAAETSSTEENDVDRIEWEVGKQQQDEEVSVRPSRLMILAGGSRQSDRSEMKLSHRGSLIKTGSSRSLGSGASEQREKSELKPTIVRLNPRLDSLDVIKQEEVPSSEWSEDRRHFQQELRASRRDVQFTKQQCDRVERLAQVRHTQLLKESARKLRANEQKRDDAKAVRQLIADTLEYRDELYTMESRKKQASIAAYRDQERVKRQTRVVLGNTEKHLRGVVKLGPGPLSKKEMESLNGDSPAESAVYDLHGRRHRLQEAGQVATHSALESAMRKVWRLVLQSKNSVEVFRRYDVDRSGSLSYAEFQRMMRENGTGDAAELTQEQSQAVFKRFDTDDSGEVDYVELLWGFFDSEAFLKRWHERKSATTTAQTEREVEQLFRKLDRSSEGVLLLKDFQLVIDDLGVTLSDNDAKLLAVKFDAGKDGYIDYHKFLQFTKLASQDNRAPVNEKPEIQSVIPLNLTPTAHPGMQRIWKELQSLSATQEKLHRLLRK